MRWNPNTSARTSGGYMSGMSELWVGVTTARPMPGTGAGDDEHPHREGGAGEQPEDRPDRGAEQRDAHAGEPVGVVRERYFEQQTTEQRECDERQELLVRHTEVVADVGSEHAEQAAVGFVEGVEREQDDERVDRVTRG